MILRDRLKPFLNILKAVTVCGSGVLIIVFHFKQTIRNIEKIVNPSVLQAERKYNPEYIYVDDPAYDATIKEQHHAIYRRTVGFARIWKSFKHSIQWKLLWICRYGSKEQRNIAIEQLAEFKNNKIWDCLKLAQALDQNTAVLLARTRGADLRYFLPPPIHIRKAALTSELLSFKFRDILASVQAKRPHSCIQYFLNKYFVNLLDQPVEVDSFPTKPDSVSERDLCLLCLEALYHHLSLFNDKNFSLDTTSSLLVKLGILPRLAEAMLRYKDDEDIDLAVLSVLTILSVHKNLLTDFFQNGIIRDLSRLLNSNSIRLSSSAAVCLANLSGEFSYQPGIYLLHPIYRTRTPPRFDTLLVHGLRGGVFVTWRQRDDSYSKPVGFIDATVTSFDKSQCNENTPENKFLDPELQEVIQDMIESEEDSLLSSLEVVLEDIPILAKRESTETQYTAKKKRLALIQENRDKCNYSHCWPKDWLPQDYEDIRVLGVNYFSTLSDWVERCPLQNADINTRANELSDKLFDADVGKKNIIWLAHSMGGLIVKKLLVDIAQNDNSPYKSLCEKTKAVVFYSTPHKGSSLAAMPRAAAAILWPSQDVKQLRENSPMLLELHSSFINCADFFKWETISFAETLPTLVTAFKVPIHFVASCSADLGRGVFYELPLDHLTICKPASRQSIIYTTILEILQRYTEPDTRLIYWNPFLQKILHIIYLTLSAKIREILEDFDDYDNYNNDIERTVLNAFTDDFIF